MPNMFGGSQDHPDYTGIAPRARSKYEGVSDGILYKLVGNFVESETLEGATVRYFLDDEELPTRIRNRFKKVLETKRPKTKRKKR